MYQRAMLSNGNSCLCKSSPRRLSPIPLSTFILRLLKSLTYLKTFSIMCLLCPKSTVSSKCKINPSSWNIDTYWDLFFQQLASQHAWFKRARLTRFFPFSETWSISFFSQWLISLSEFKGILDKSFSFRWSGHRDLLEGSLMQCTRVYRFTRVWISVNPLLTFKNWRASCILYTLYRHLFC